MTAGGAISTGWRAGARPARRWLPWILLLVAVLALLVVAETVWIPESLPREYASRSSVVLVPVAGAGVQGDESWSASVTRAAAAPIMARAMVADLGLRDAESGLPLDPRRLLDDIRITAQCVRVPVGRDATVVGVRLSATVRGTDRDQVDAVAAAWQARVGGVVEGVARPVVVDAASPLLPCEGV
ncbi:MAG: hypothetical protein HYY34_04760 [Chloroflexi bacterium]|nr:hypothetical protein [Chloroflexota bacterium]